MKKFLALLAMAASLLAVSCHKNNDEDDDDQKQEESQGLGNGRTDPVYQGQFCQAQHISITPPVLFQGSHLIG